MPIRVIMILGICRFFCGSLPNQKLKIRMLCVRGTIGVKNEIAGDSPY